MGAMRINVAALAFLVVLATSAVGKTSAATYVVRDSAGWGIPINGGGGASYPGWASQHTFLVGDHLVFNFVTGAHDVAIVTKANYDGCLSSNPISIVTVGPATVNLSSPGEAYFICTFSQHCSLGQQLAINVSSGTTPPTPPTTPPPTSPPPAATPPTTTPPPSTSPPTTTPPPPSTSPPTTTPPPSTSPPTTTPAPAKPGPAAPAPVPAAPAPAPGTGAPTPGMSGPSPAPGPGGAAPSPSVSPSPSPGGGASSPEASPPPGESPPPAGESAPPPNAAPPTSVTATATIFVMFMSLAVVIFF